MNRFDPVDFDAAYRHLEHEDQMAADLWRAVIAQALRDLDSKDVEVKLEAAQWLGSPDYHECCDCALVDARVLEERVRGYLGLANPYRRLELFRLADDVVCGNPESAEDLDGYEVMKP